MNSARIFQINISQGGVPKRPVSQAEITFNGLRGDHQNDLKHHGGFDRAVCLYSLETIILLQKEDHPIFPGSTGENLTITGLNWELMVPDIQLKIGSDIKLETVSFTHPCKTIAKSFVDKNFTRISQEIHPGWSRLYARVLETGVVQVSDEVHLINH